MFRKTSLLVAAASLALIPVATPEPAHAGGEGVAAGIIGFAAGAIIGSQMNRPRERRVYRSAPQRPRRSAAEREYWMNVQASLNRLGFDAGPVDGAPGRKTRSAVTEFQMSINAVPNGKLTSEQASVLFARVNSGNSMATAPAQPAPYMQPGTMPAYQQQPQQQPAYGMPVGGYQAQQGFPAMQQPFPQGGQQQAAFPAPQQGGFPQQGQQAAFPAPQQGFPQQGQQAAFPAPQQGGLPQQGQQAAFPAPTQQPATATAGSAAFPLVNGAVSGAGTQPTGGFPPLAGSNTNGSQAPVPASTAPALLQQPEPAATPGGQAAPPATAPTSEVATSSGSASFPLTAAFPLVNGTTSQASVDDTDSQGPVPASTAPALLQQPEPAATPGGQVAPAQQAQPIIQTDASGNQFVEINGQRFYMNAAPASPAAPAAAPPAAVVVTAETDAQLQPQQ
ncbi:peptidoglycan-binding domain-containing protein [Stappia indica]|uniref:peptidoglycan-binding domain-containing protein n=1 Tax=Stappia indica TaxID=538381 RepID=UPI001D197324|nr:peptidoglycan-binding domain-containing protein [Stappia indica]MCC4244126.1 peptidoglycan-binding protein [Stappia indica]